MAIDYLYRSLLEGSYVAIVYDDMEMPSAPGITTELIAHCGQSANGPLVFSYAHKTGPAGTVSVPPGAEDLHIPIAIPVVAVRNNYGIGKDFGLSFVAGHPNPIVR